MPEKAWPCSAGPWRRLPALFCLLLASGGTALERRLGPAEVSIFDIQHGGDGKGLDYFKKTVSFHAVVTAVVSADWTWVQDPEGLEYSGIFLYKARPRPRRGDLLHVQGRVMRLDEKQLLSYPHISVMSSDNVLPAPVVLQSGAVEASHQYHGMLVSLVHATVTDPNPDADSGKDYGSFVVDDGSGSAWVDGVGDRITLDPQGQEVLASITGVLTYSYGRHRIVPRDDCDLVLEGSSGCSESAPSAVGVSIADVQRNRAASWSQDEVVVRGVVTAVFRDGRIFIQQPTGGQYSGLSLVRPLPSARLADFVEATGRLSQASGYIQMLEPWLRIVSSGNLLPRPHSIATAADELDSWEGVLVTVRQATVTTAYADHAFTVDDGSGPVRVLVSGVDLTREPAAGEVYSAITGVLHHVDGAVRLLPRTDCDLEMGGTRNCSTRMVTTIHEVQIGADAGVDFNGRAVAVMGIVTGNFENFTFLQEAAGSTRIGLALYRPWQRPSLGDMVRAVGVVSEHSGVTQVVTPHLHILSHGHTQPSPVIVRSGATSRAELESMLVQLQDITVTQVSAGTGGSDHGHFVVDDGSGAAHVGVVHDRLTHVPAAGAVFASVTGVLHSSGGRFEVWPRDDCDLRLRGSEDCGSPEPVSISQVQGASQEVSAWEGRHVAVQGVVTSVIRMSSGDYYVYIQDPEGRSDSGMMLYNPVPLPERGDVVEAAGVVSEYDSETHLTVPVIQVRSSAPLPSPVVLSDGQLAGEAYEGMRVRIELATVTHRHDTGVLGMLYEVSYGSSNVLLAAGSGVARPPEVGDKYASITGVLAQRQAGFVIVVQDACDLLLEGASPCDGSGPPLPPPMPLMGVAGEPATASASFVMMVVVGLGTVVLGLLVLGLMCQKYRKGLRRRRSFIASEEEEPQGLIVGRPIDVGFEGSDEDVAVGVPTAPVAAAAGKAGKAAESLEKPGRDSGSDPEWSGSWWEAGSPHGSGSDTATPRMQFMPPPRLGARRDDGEPAPALRRNDSDTPMRWEPGLSTVEPSGVDLDVEHADAAEMTREPSADPMEVSPGAVSLALPEDAEAPAPEAALPSEAGTAEPRAAFNPPPRARAAQEPGHAGVAPDVEHADHTQGLFGQAVEVTAVGPSVIELDTMDSPPSSSVGSHTSPPRWQQDAENYSV